MKSVYSVFIKAIVSDYYRKNALFIFVVVLFAFGFLSGQEHLAIGKQIIASPTLIFSVSSVWLLYGLKTILFVLRSLSLPEFRFLFALRLLSFQKRFIVWFFIAFLLNQLTLYYAAFLIYLGIVEAQVLPVFLIIILQLFILLLCVLVFEYRIRKEPEQTFRYSFRLPFKLKYSLPHFLFYHKYLLLREPVLLFLTKGFSILALLCFIWLYPTDDYDYRLFGIAAVIVAVSHVRICSQWLYFQYNNLQFYQNLPLSQMYKIAVIILGYFIILLPEIGLFVWRTHTFIDPLFVFTWCCFAMAMVIFIHFYAYLISISEDSKAQYFFFGVILVLIVVMYKIPLAILSVLFFVSGVSIYLKNEKKFELS